VKEEMTMCAHDAHDWQPIAGWYARYRCSICRVIGYKPCAVHPQHCRRTAIEPYRCEATRDGKRCNAPAVHTWHGTRFRCAEHLHRGRTAGARKKLDAAVTHRPEVTSAAREVVSAAREVVSGAREVVSAAHEVVSAAHEVVSAAREVVSAAHEVVSDAREVVSGAREVVSGAHEVVSAAREVSLHGPQLSPSKGNA
jgi:hypothetical protein